MLENSLVGSVILQTSAKDVDAGKNSEFHFNLITDDPEVANAFHIRPTGEIVVKSNVDREQFSGFNFTVTATDHGKVPLTGTALVFITVDDVNDEVPRFVRDGYVFNIFENEPNGSLVGHVLAEDRDSPPNNRISYSLAQPDSTARNCFSIDPDSGSISTSAVLDREKQSVYILRICASNSFPEWQNASGCVSVTIFVQDRNDNDPIFAFPTDTDYEVIISNLVPLGHVVTKVSASDSDVDSNSRLKYYLKTGNDNGAFSIDPDSGVVYISSGFYGIEFNEYELVIVAKDQGSPSRWTQSLLRVIVNGSLPVDWDPQTGSELESGAHKHLVSAALWLSGGFVALAIVLLSIGVVTRGLNRRKKEKQLYLKRMERVRSISINDKCSTYAAGSSDDFRIDDLEKNIPLRLNGSCGKGSPGSKTLRTTGESCRLSISI